MIAKNGLGSYQTETHKTLVYYVIVPGGNNNISDCEIDDKFKSHSDNHLLTISVKITKKLI